VKRKYFRINIIFLHIIWFTNSIAGAVSLNEAFKSALDKIETMGIAKSQLRVSQAHLNELGGNFYPSISASGAYQLQNKNIGSLSAKDQATAKLTLTESLYAGGRDSVNFKAAELEKEVQEFNVASSKNDIYIQVSKNFYALMSANKEVENIKKTIGLTQKRIKELVIRKKIGKSRHIEVLAAEAQLSLLEAQLLAAEGEQSNATNMFVNSTGLPSDTQLNDNGSMPKDIKPLADYLALVGQRPDILGLRSKVKETDFLIEAANANNRPSLDLTSNYYPYRYRYLQSNPDWDAYLVLTIPIYSGGISQARIQQVIEKKSQAELYLQQEYRESDRKIQMAYNTLKSSLQQVKALEKALAATEQNYLEQEKDYRYSLATNLDVLQALNTFQDTKRSLDRTKFLVLSAYAELKAAANQVEE
jgi:outer membrane protein